MIVYNAGQMEPGQEVAFYSSAKPGELPVLCGYAAAEVAIAQKVAGDRGMKLAAGERGIVLAWGKMTPAICAGHL